MAAIGPRRATGEPGPRIRRGCHAYAPADTDRDGRLGALGGLAGLVLAQSEGEGSGTVTVTEENIVEIDSGQDVDGTFWNAADVKASDPRLSGAWTENRRCQPGSGFMTCVGTVRVENEGGTWLGRVEGFGHDAGMFDWTVLEGQGGYEGLTALRLISEVMDGEPATQMVIIDFEMPAQPEAKLLPAE